MKKYKVISAKGISKFNKKVKRAIKKGWNPFHNRQSLITDSQIVFSQQFIKFKKRNCS